MAALVDISGVKKLLNHTAAPELATFDVNVEFSILTSAPAQKIAEPSMALLLVNVQSSTYIRFAS